MVGDFDGDGAADIAFVDQDSSDLNVSGYLAGNRNGNINICLSRMATTGTFDCKAVAMPAVQLTPAQETTFINAQFAAYPDGVPDAGPTNAMFLSTQANGRTDLLLYWTLDPSALTNQRCSYTPPTSSAADDWSWTCGQYAGIFSTMNTALGETAAPYLAALGNWWPVPRHAYPIPPSPITNNSINAAVFPGIVVGDFIGAGLSSFIAQRPSAYPLGSGNNSDLYVAVANSSPINGVGLTPIIGGAQASPYVSPPVSSNQFIWSAGTAAQKQTAINRYFVRESRGTELGGTPLGDINGDGYTDYLMTFEGHAEICYSFGVDGFDCHLMEDQTPGWNPTTFNFPASVSTVASSTTIPSGITVAVDGQGLVPSNASTGLFGVYSVLSVGHASDSNLQEVIYRRGDGGNFASYQSNNGGPGVGGDQYYVCTVRDGMKNCIPWTGPNLRPPASGSDNVGYPIPGVAFNPSKGAIAWPNAGHMVGDFTGQGRTQILWYCDSQCSDANPVSGAPTQVQAGQGWQLFMPNVSGSIDRLMSVRNGNGNTSSVDYTPMSSPSVYTAQANDLVTGQPIPVTYPLQRTVDNGRMLASAIHTDDGNGSLTSYYQYHGLTSDVTGRGEQGFAIVTVTNPQGTTASTQYAQGFPYTGMVLATTLMSSTGTLMEQVDNRPLTSVSTVAATGNAVNAPVSYPMPIAGHTYCSYAPTSTVQRHDLNGVATTQTTTTINNADAYCNILNSTATTIALNDPASRYSTTTANTINNFTANGSTWIIGQIAQTVSTKAEPISASINAAQATITRTKAFTYYANGLLQSDTTEPGNTTLSVKTFYDRNPSSTCGGLGNPFGLVNCTSQGWHDPVINVDTSRTLNTVTYDAQGRFPISVTNILGHVDSHAYDDTSGAQISLTGPNGLNAIWTVDGFGRTLTETHADHMQTNSYRKLCRATTSVPNPTACPVIFGVTPATVTFVDHVTDATLNGVRTSAPELVYSDSAGHTLRAQKYGFTGAEIDTDFSYDQYGRVAISYQPTFAGAAAVKASTNGYDELSRVTAIVTNDESGSPQTTRTDFNGLSVTVTNPKNESKTEIRDPLGRVAQSINTPNDGVNSTVNTWFAFDAWGNLVQTKDQLGNIVSIGYDNLGRKTSMHDPDLGNISYSIDPRGLQYSQTSARGFVTTYVYDPLDRMIARNESDLTSTWVYDQPASSGTNPAVCAAAHSCGKLIESKSLLGSVTDYDRLQTYDGLGRASVTTTTLDTVYTNTAHYDAWGRPSYNVAVRGALSKTFGQRYNQYGYMAQVVRTTGTTDQVLWEAEKQDAASRITNANLGNGVAVGRTFNVNTGRLTEGTLNDKTGTQILEEGYVYDQVGNVTDRIQYWYPGLANQNGVAENFQYDGLNRLANSTVYGQPQQVFTYDAIGDITSKTGVGTYSYPTSGPNAVRPHAVASISSLGSFSYDASGNMMAGAGRSYTNWTSFDMPVTITQGGASSTFVYGPEHQRTTQTKGDGSVIVYADGMEVDTSASGAVTVKSYWPAGLGLDTDTLNASGASVANVQNWTHTDRLGSTIGLTDINGVPQEMLAYDAWGSRRNLNGTALTPGYVGKLDDHGYTGQEMLDQLGLVHMNGRVYDPLVGRFLSADPMIQDPMHSQSYNRYTYVWNNPTNLSDPTGFEAEDAPASVPGAAAAQMHEAQGWTTVYSAGSVIATIANAAANGQTIVVVGSNGIVETVQTAVTGTGTSTGANASSSAVAGSGTQGTDQAGSTKANTDKGGIGPAQADLSPNYGAPKSGVNGEPEGVSDSVETTSKIHDKLAVSKDGKTLEGTLVYDFKNGTKAQQDFVRDGFKGVNNSDKGLTVNITLREYGSSFWDYFSSPDFHVTFKLASDVLSPYAGAAFEHVFQKGYVQTLYVYTTDNGKLLMQGPETLVHEFGHALGLQHQWNYTQSIMSYNFSARNHELMYDDIKKLLPYYDKE